MCVFTPELEDYKEAEEREREKRERKRKKD